MNIEDVLSDGIILSTSLLSNWYGNYRTYITFDNRHSLVILEDYISEEDAMQGHETYKNMNIEELIKLDKV